MDTLKIQEERKKVVRELRERMLGYLIGALGLVAGLAWNDAIRAFIEYLFPLNKDSIHMKFVYALVISLIIVVASFYLTRVVHKEDEIKK